MTLTLLWLVLVLLASVVLGLVRVMLGPTPTDRMLAAQLMGSAGVAMLVVLAQALARPSLLDVALVFAVLAAVAAVAFVRQYSPRNAGAQS